MKRVVIGAPAQRSAGDLALIGRIDEVALVVVPGSPVVEDGGSPGDGLSLAVAGEGSRDGPVAPVQGREEMVASLARHVDRLSIVGLRMVGLRSVVLGKVERALAGIVEHGSRKQHLGAAE